MMMVMILGGKRFKGVYRFPWGLAFLVEGFLGLAV